MKLNYLRKLAKYRTQETEKPNFFLHSTARRMVAAASNSLESCKRIAKEGGANILRWTIGRLLRGSQRILRDKN